MALAARVPGCTPAPVRTRAVLDSIAPELTPYPGVFSTASSMAACTLRGRTVVIFGFTDRAQQSRNEAILRHVDAIYAAGSRWTAAPTKVTQPVVQESMIGDYAVALHGLIRRGTSAR